MNLLSLFLIAIGLSMDAFAVSVCKGLSLKKAAFRHAVLTGLWFGGFQAFMPFLGYLLGSRFERYITSIDHWIAFVLLSLIGGSMIKDAKQPKQEKFSTSPIPKDAAFDASLSPKAMFPLAIATSIDALAIGVTFAFLQVDVLPAVAFIGITTFLFSTAGVKVGNLFGFRYKGKAELAGGSLLIVMGIKILLEHLR
ncbi:MAG: manganese efflux pump MntP family protein [Clostridium sp.]|jgi:putative Mn2+ efflux pump MntP|nr:manganese efflux pump MntP family protein [Clostridium sp.]